MSNAHRILDEKTNHETMEVAVMHAITRAGGRAGCDSGDPLDFIKAEITQAISYFEDEYAEREQQIWERAIRIVRTWFK